jgi:hypothetical protein
VRGVSLKKAKTRGRVRVPSLLRLLLGDSEDLGHGHLTPRQVVVEVEAGDDRGRLVLTLVDEEGLFGFEFGTDTTVQIGNEVDCRFRDGDDVVHDVSFLLVVSLYAK